MAEFRLFGYDAEGLARCSEAMRSFGISAREAAEALAAAAPAFAEIARHMEVFRLAVVQDRMDRLGPWIGAAVMLGTLALAALAGVIQ